MSVFTFKDFHGMTKMFLRFYNRLTLFIKQMLEDFYFHIFQHVEVQNIFTHTVSESLQSLQIHHCNANGNTHTNTT